MSRFSTLLVANRGEIACRILRTAGAQGYRTVAVYTDADAQAPHVAMADTAVRVGAGPAADSYLDIERIVRAAVDSGADAVHPGYGFLSENGDFARACEAAGLVFVGPNADVIDAMGNKAEAKRRMRAAGVPCVPGYEGEDQSDAALVAAADRIGWPVMVKAAAGGGGRGMRMVENAAALPDALARARSEARQAFGSGELILEKVIGGARHVEIQVFADTQGCVVHLGERDCSVQRRHQKVLEEAPSPAVDDALRERMGRAAVKAAASIAYRGAGTVEFLLDGEGAFYFLEMNTRLQVEHAVTELVTGLDLVALQLAVAQGEPLALQQDDIALRGHAIEARLYAEDPDAGFLPQSGTIALWSAAWGAGVRVDAGVCSGQAVPPFYDPLLAKIVAHGRDREQSRRRLLDALRATVLLGVRTNRDFLIGCAAHETFAAGEARTDFVAAAGADLRREAPAFRHAALAGALAAELACQDALAAAVAVAPELANFSSAGTLRHERVWRAAGEDIALAVTGLGPGNWRVSGDGGTVQVRVDVPGDDLARLTVDGRRVEARFARGADGALHLHAAGHAHVYRPGPRARGATAGENASSAQVVAPMHAQVLEIHVAAGDVVEEGEPLLVLEAMKMQHVLSATRSGTVAEIAATPGAQVAPQDVLLVVTPAAG